MQLTDTHCHIQFKDYPIDPEEAIKNAREEGVNRLIVVGCTLPDSQDAAEFAATHKGVWASIGLHPHEGSRYVHDHHALQQFRELATKPKVVAIGETGLDYFYNNAPKANQLKLLRFQLDMAAEFSLPLIFHVRDAFDDFFKVFDEYKGLRGVVHSFTATKKELEALLSRGLYVGLNGIMTFTNKSQQLEAAKAVPSDRLLLETDAPFLTPSPFRGKMCEPKHVRATAEFLAELRAEAVSDLAESSTANAIKLFNLT